MILKPFITGENNLDKEHIIFYYLAYFFNTRSDIHKYYNKIQEENNPYGRDITNKYKLEDPSDFSLENIWKRIPLKSS